MTSDTRLSFHPGFSFHPQALFLAQSCKWTYLGKALKP